ncbi:MAG: hypothetical protein ACI4OE_04010 [Alphaproteobacteria bacterium]|nr:hypothetical protein [Alphaproteobacteria bacterium]MDY4689022.1 hypothetical protein [Alphaproteobacteria bacterium]
MNGQTFLQKALEQSFKQPLMTDYNNIDFVFCRDSSGNFIMGDKSECNFAPCLISSSEIKNCINNACHDIRHSSALNHEYETFRHYFEENIIIPEKTPTIQSLRLWLDLTSVSRQAAQKKRVIAALMPPRFKETLADMEKGYRAALKKVQLCEQENLDAVEIALITDFTASYHKVMFSFSGYDCLFFANKLRLRQALLCALNIIKEKGSVPVEFELQHPFLGSGCKWSKAYAGRCRSNMLMLISKLQNLAHNESLFELAQTYLQNRSRYQQKFHDFCNSRRAPNLDDIIAIKKAAQTMFNEFTKLCYLEGVRKAFEVNFLDTCPSPQNPPLPSVAPNEEIGKIRNIVESCRQIDCKKTRTGNFFYNALESYQNSRAEIDKILTDYIGIADLNFNREIA